MCAISAVAELFIVIYLQTFLLTLPLITSFASLFQSSISLLFPTDSIWAMMFFGRDYQNCSVLYCVLKLPTVISTLRWAVLTVLWIGFCHTEPILLCVDLFVFICVYFASFCFIVHMCCIIVSAVGWTRGVSSLILSTYLSSVLWCCKNPSPIWPIMCLVGC